MSWPVNRNGWLLALRRVSASHWSGRKCGEISTVTLLHSGVFSRSEEEIRTKCMSIASFAVWFVLPQLQLSSPPGRSFISHAAKVTTAPSPIVALTRRVDAEENTAVRWQVFAVPGFRRWGFLVELLLKLLKAREGHKRGIPGRAEVILGQILECVRGIVRINCRIGYFAAGGTVVVNRPMLRDTRKGECALLDERFGAG
jgi:hypothetical protein